MHEGGHGILEKRKVNHFHEAHDHEHNKNLKVKIIAGLITAAVVVAVILWKIL